MIEEKISPQTIESVRQALDATISDRIQSLWFEIQDDGAFLLIVAEAKPLTSDDEAESILDTIDAIVRPLISPRNDRHSWMAVVRDNGHVRSARQSDL